MGALPHSPLPSASSTPWHAFVTSMDVWSFWMTTENGHDDSFIMTGSTGGHHYDKVVVMTNLCLQSEYGKNTIRLVIKRLTARFHEIPKSCDIVQRCSIALKFDRCVTVLPAFYPNACIKERCDYFKLHSRGFGDFMKSCGKTALTARKRPVNIIIIFISDVKYIYAGWKHSAINCSSLLPCYAVSYNLIHAAIKSHI